MRLTRVTRTPQGNSLLVGEVPPPAWNLAPAMDDQQQFTGIYRRLHGPLLDHAERFLSTEDARDAVGDAVTSLWIRWSALSHEKRTDAYIFGVLHHCISAKQKENSRLVSLEDAEPELDQRTSRVLLDEIRGDSITEVLDAALAALPARRREVFLLVKEQSFSRRQAAEALGLSEQTIGTHLRLATADLRATFRRAGFRIPASHPLRLSSPKGGDTND